MLLRTTSVLLIFMLTACGTTPHNAFRLSESALAIRDLQTREYPSMTDEEILSASMAVLQDLGYTIDEMEGTLGVLSASKRADASDQIKVFGSLALDGVKCVFTFGLGCTGSNYKKSADVQDIRLTLVTRPKPNDNHDVIVRVTIQRIVWDKTGRISEQQSITDNAVYSSFFEKMSKAVFLERQGV